MIPVGLAILALLSATISWAQAPPSADLWRLAATTLPRPAALETGATGAFWNPSAAADRGLAVGLQLIETPDVIGVSGLVAGITYALGGSTSVLVMVGRTDIDDLVRTTTSATSEGEIPIYEQHAAVGGVFRVGRLRLGVLARAHDARFDAERNSGITADLGVRWTPIARLTLAAATHFFPINLKDRATTDYYGGVEYQARALRILDTPSRILARYAISFRQGNTGDRRGTIAPDGISVEHGVGLGLALADRLSADALYTREVGYGAAEWRPSVGIALRVGHYAITAARASGLNGLGATYRIGLDVDVIP